MGLFASNPPSLIPANQQSAGSVNQTASRLNAGSRGVKDAAAQSMFQSTGGALSSLQDQIDNIMKVLREPIPQPDAYGVTDPNGKMIAWIGYNAVNNVVYEGGWFADIYVGGTAADNAPLFSNGSQVVIGKNGQVFIQDLGANTVGWFGVERETAKVITVATNASPSVITIAAHGYVNGDTVGVAGALGNTAINGYRIVQNVTLNTFTMTDLLGTAINGNGAYTGSGTATRYYAGVLTQTIAIGTSFANYKLRAFADGSLKIQNAIIDLSSAAGEIILDPSVPSITVTSTSTSEVSSIDPINGFMQTDGTLTFQAISGVVTVSSASFLSRVGQGTVNVGDLSNVHARIDADSGSGGGSVSVSSTAGAYKAGFEVVSTHGVVCLDGLSNHVLSRDQLSIDGGASVQKTQIGAKANALGFIGLFCGAANSSALEYDIEVIAGVGTAQDTSVAAIRKGSAQLQFLGATGNVVGTPAVFNTLGILDLSNGHWGFGNVVAPSYSVDAQTDVNAGGVFRVAGAAGITGTLALNVTTVNLQYKDWAGVNQTQTIVTNVTITGNAFTGGIRTT